MGFDLDRLATAGFGLPVDQYTVAEAAAFYREVADRLRAADPAARVSVAELPPVGVAHAPLSVLVPGHAPPPGQTGVVVDGGYWLRDGGNPFARGSALRPPR